MSTPNPHPKVCPHCYGRVYLCTNDVIYGRRYGYPWIYYCPTCGAYVGCHKGTYRALGRLATAEERRQRKELHALFDSLWKGKKHSHYKRSVAYRELSVRLYGADGDAHFGWMQNYELSKARQVVCDMLRELTKNPNVWQLWSKALEQGIGVRNRRKI